MEVFFGSVSFLFLFSLFSFLMAGKDTAGVLWDEME
jgi:hypothetical protein